MNKKKKKKRYPLRPNDRFGFNDFTDYQGHSLQNNNTHKTASVYRKKRRLCKKQHLQKNVVKTI